MTLCKLLREPSPVGPQLDAASSQSRVSETTVANSDCEKAVYDVDILYIDDIHIEATRG